MSPPSKKGSKVDAALAAPDAVLKNEQEKRKYRRRKKEEAAEKARLQWYTADGVPKKRGRPSAEDLLGDMVRVAGDKDANPNYWQFKSLSRRRYQLFGRFPVEFIDERYGQWAHAMQVAGLQDKPGERQKKAARSEQSRREHLMRYCSRYITPYVVKDAELERELVGYKRMLSISDTHATFLDPFTWEVFLSSCRDQQPDIILLNGDILEGSEITRFPKIPGWTIPLQLEFDFAREMFRQLRDVCPNAQIVWGSGNHGLDRLASYLTQVAPAIAGLRGMRFDQLAGIEELDIELLQGGTIASPEGTEEQYAGRLWFGHYYTHHGTCLGKTPAHNELIKVGYSGQSGHVHRASVAWGTTLRDQANCWMSTPMGCTKRAGRAYIKGPTAGWQKGFGSAWLGPDGFVQQSPIITSGEHAVVDGYVYTRRSNELPDPTKNWLKDFTL